MCACLCVQGENRIVENCVKRTLHNKQKLRLTSDSFPSVASKCSESNPSLLTSQTQILIMCCSYNKLSYFAALVKIMILWFGGGGVGGGGNLQFKFET